MNRVFADFDETWTDHPEIWYQVEAIVTGNSWQKLEKVLHDYIGPRRPIFFNPQDEKDLDTLGIVNHKADIINKCMVTKYFENNPETVSMLQLLCPKTKIILVKEGETAI